MKIYFMPIFIAVFLISCFIFTIFKNFKTLKANNYRQLAMVLAISIFALSLLILFYYLRRIGTEKPTILLKLLEFLKN
ncbi:hypothetical protein KST04_00155 [Fusobacterium vincentii]|uniref:hypothetical protein n=1 Tax=Fusobacterium vincentii TaxID=155615 RepID=UPI00324E20B7